MIKRLPLVAQITIIFLAAFVLTALLLGLIITRRLDSLYENTVYERLEAESKAIRLVRPDAEYETEENIAYIRYKESDNTYMVSDNMMTYIDAETINLLIGKALSQSTYQARYTNTVGGQQIYYVVLNYQGVLDINEDVFIILTDTSMKNTLIKTTRRQIYLASIISFALGYMIIFAWITKLIDDTKKISSSLKKIGENHYRTEVSTKRGDEMGELVGDIESMRKKIIENERSRQEIIQGVSHDLKTPIALISSYAEAYEDGMCEADELSGIAKRETARLNAKVTKLLNLTRLNYIDTNFDTMGLTDMKSLIAEIVGTYGFHEKIKISAALLNVSFLGDRESWFNVMENILDNAMRYAESTINIELGENRLTVYNDGPAIDPELLPNIFKAYEKGAGGKSGIGLSIVKRTVELFGYNVEAENSENGVSFTIYK